MKILLGLMAFFMLPSVTGLGSGIGNAIAAKNNTQDNVRFLPRHIMSQTIILSI